MKRLVKVATTSTATLEAVPPPYNLTTPDPEVTFARGVELVRSAARQGAELVCLPEVFAHAGIPLEQALLTAQSLDGARVAGLRAVAREEKVHLVAGAFVRDGDGVRNSALLFGADGELIARYDKVHPTRSELDAGVIPGNRPVVADTPVGRIGFCTCFDLNWPGDWESMHADGAELVIFLSAYEGGFPLRALAWQYRLHVVSTVWPYEARIIDPLGRSLASTSRWTRLAVHDVDLDTRIFHINQQIGHFERLAETYGDRIHIVTLTDEHLVAVSRRDGNLDLDDIIEQFGLVELDAFLASSSPEPVLGGRMP